MRGLAETAGMPDVRRRRAFFRFEIVCQDQPLAARGGTLLFCVAEFISEIAMSPRPSES